MATAEILCIGTELLLGQITNTNSQWISQQLAQSGIDCLYHTTVGDNPGRIKDAFRDAFNRVDIVITTGGLGPTSDDLTHESLAELFEVEMVIDEAVLAHIEQLFSKRSLVMPPSNRKQAQRPHGADLLPNPRGTAPGVVWNIDTALLHQIGIEQSNKPRYVLTFPGVPAEMKAMWEETARVFLNRQFGEGIVWSCDLKHYGISESALAERYQYLLDGTSPTVAPLAGKGECRLRVTAKAATIHEAKAIATPIIEKIKHESAHLCYGENEQTLESVVGEMLTNRGMTVAIAESCSGGMVSKRLTDIAGSSNYVKLNVVSYSNEAKEKVLSVSSETLVQFGAVSRECALKMAEGMHSLAESNIAVSVTGIAGPGGGTDDKPVGTVFLALTDGKKTYVWLRRYGAQLPRSEIRFRTANDALNMIRLYLISPGLLDTSA